MGSAKLAKMIFKLGKQEVIRPTHLYLIFEKSSLTKWIFNLQKSIEIDFAEYTGSKNPVQNGLKIQFVKLNNLT